MSEQNDLGAELDEAIPDDTGEFFGVIPWRKRMPYVSSYYSSVYNRMDMIATSNTINSNTFETQYELEYMRDISYCQEIK